MKKHFSIAVIILGITGVLAVAILTLPAQEARFFRISGPAATKIVAFQPDGTLIWSNSLAGTNYTVQTLAASSGGTNWVDYVQIPATNRVNTNQVIDFHPPSGMALIPAGSFTMGDNLDGESDAPVHNVYVSAFYLDQYDVTEALWAQVYNWATNHGYSFDDPGSVYDGSSEGPSYPVVDVNWYDCAKWCNARSEMEGKTAAYYTDGTLTTVYRTGDLDLSNAWVNWNAGYRLPTEAEWEKAARGGLSGQRFPWGNTITESQANYNAYPNPPNSAGYTYDVNNYSGYNTNFDTGNFPYTSPVNTFAPNGYGLCDMAGNVFQWCWDWYGTYGSGSDPCGPASGSYRVLRGGSFSNYPVICRTAHRYDDYLSIRYGNVGLRSVVPPGQ